MGAISTAILALSSSGSHVVTQRQLFSGTSQLFTQVCPRFGIDVTFVDVDDPDGWAAAVRPETSVLFVETPSNPTLALADLDAIGSIRGLVKVVDSTLATPLLQRPLDHGVDLVLHSATKALSGHNDATLGVIAGDKTIINELWGYSVIQGSCASAFDSRNGLRGLKTLGVRVKRQTANAQLIAGSLERHDSVSHVHYPGLPSHPQRSLATRQMSAGGGCVTFELAGGYPAASAFVGAVQLAELAPSLGGPETLVNHPASLTHASLTPEQRAEVGITDGMIRLSVGLEHPADLLADIEQALCASATREPVG
jgi:cystathionine beta-lyase/cystathionine gamma-synthase